MHSADERQKYGAGVSRFHAGLRMGEAQHEQGVPAASCDAGYSLSDLGKLIRDH